MLPESVKAQLQNHLEKVKAIHARDLADGWGRVHMPNALDRKYPKTSRRTGAGIWKLNPKAHINSWLGILGRAPADNPLESFALPGMPGDPERLSNFNTQMGENPQSAVATPLDLYYREVIRQRPVGTRILQDREILPKEPQ